jgi:hypothetical protein
VGNVEIFIVSVLSLSALGIVLYDRLRTYFKPNYRLTAPPIQQLLDYQVSARCYPGSKRCTDHQCVS